MTDICTGQVFEEKIDSFQFFNFLTFYEAEMHTEDAPTGSPNGWHYNHGPFAFSKIVFWSVSYA